MRTKRGIKAHRRRKNLLKHAKGFKWTRHSKYRQAKEALLHAWSFQFADRRKKKRNFRRLWQIKINAAARQNGISYSRLMAALRKADIRLDRKMLANLGQYEPEIFKKIAERIPE